MKRIIPILLVLLMIPFISVRADEDGKLIRQGDKGEEVVRIQTRLFDLGFYTYKPTGSYRTVTRTAVMSYQAASGLMNDGSVGQETADSLFARGAKRADYHAWIPLSFTAQGPIVQKGSPTAWKLVRPMLTEGSSYRIRNAATEEELTLLFESGKNHADMILPPQDPDRSAAVTMLTKWLGSANSFYKCAVLFEIDSQWIAASIQWNGKDRICVYFKDSVSHVLDLPDAEHAANIQKVGG